MPTLLRVVRLLLPSASQAASLPFSPVPPEAGWTTSALLPVPGVPGAFARARVRVGGVARSQPERRHRRQGQGPGAIAHYFVVLDALLDGVLLVSLLVELPEEPVPVAPIELVPEPPEAVEPLPLMPDEPVLPVDGDVLLLPGVVPVPLEPLVVPPPPAPRLHADKERAAVTVRTAAVTWVRVIFIGKLLRSD